MRFSRQMYVGLFIVLLMTNEAEVPRILRFTIFYAGSFTDTPTIILEITLYKCRVFYGHPTKTTRNSMRFSRETHVGFFTLLLMTNKAEVPIIVRFKVFYAGSFTDTPTIINLFSFPFAIFDS